MDELVKRLQELAERIAPPVLDAARGAVKVEAVSSMIGGVELICVACVIAYAAKYLWKREAVSSIDAGVPQFFAGLFMLIALIVASIGLWSFIDPWVWVALNNPDLYLAKRILKL